MTTRELAIGNFRTVIKKIDPTKTGIAKTEQEKETAKQCVDVAGNLSMDFAGWCFKNKWTQITYGQWKNGTQELNTKQVFQLFADEDLGVFGVK